MANPLIVIAMVKTVDGYLVFARRSEKVALFQNQIHLIGGTVPRNRETLTGADIFQAMRDEITEEAGVRSNEIRSLRCIGLRLHMPHRNRAIAFNVSVKIAAADMEANDKAVPEHIGWGTAAARLRCRIPTMDAAAWR